MLFMCCEFRCSIQVVYISRANNRPTCVAVLWEVIPLTWTYKNKIVAQWQLFSCDLDNMFMLWFSPVGCTRKFTHGQKTVLSHLFLLNAQLRYVTETLKDRFWQEAPEVGFGVKLVIIVYRLGIRKPVLVFLYIFILETLEILVVSVVLHVNLYIVCSVISISSVCTNVTLSMWHTCSI